MAKKNFKNNLDDLFKENLPELSKQNDDNEKNEKKLDIKGIDLNDITDEKLKWLLIKIDRYEKELKLWRTGELTVEKFNESLKKFNLKYDPEINSFRKI